MAKIVIAGEANCPHYARIELLADKLNHDLPEFAVHKVVVQPDKWEGWLSKTCSDREWVHKRSPLVWRELVARGGKGVLIGGHNEFQEFVKKYYGVESDMVSAKQLAIAEENLATKIGYDKEQESLDSLADPLYVTVTNAASKLAYNVVMDIMMGRCFGSRDIALRLYDRRYDVNTFPDNLDENDVSLAQEATQGVQMELEDLASERFHSVKVAATFKEAVSDADYITFLEELQPLPPKEEPLSAEPIIDDDIHDDGERIQIESRALSSLSGASSRSSAAGRHTAASRGERVNSADDDEPRITVDSPPQSPVTPAGERRSSAQQDPAPIAPTREPSQVPTTAPSESDAIPPIPYTAYDDTSLVSFAELFATYGRVMDGSAKHTCKILLAGVGPLNFCARVLLDELKRCGISRQHVVTLARHLERQAKGILSRQIKINSAGIRNVIVWGDPSTRHCVDTRFALLYHFGGAIKGPDSYCVPAVDFVYDRKWFETNFAREVVERSQKSRDQSASPLSHSAAVSALLADWAGASDHAEIFSLGVCSQGWYGVPEGAFVSLPVTMRLLGQWSVVQDVEMNEVMETELETCVREYGRMRVLIRPEERAIFFAAEVAAEEAQRQARENEEREREETARKIEEEAAAADAAAAAAAESANTGGDHNAGQTPVTDADEKDATLNEGDDDEEEDEQEEVRAE